MPFRDSSKHLLRVYRAAIRSSIVREMEFRANFVLGLIRQIGWLFIFILMIKTVFAHTSSLSGWNESEVLIILALSRLIEGGLNMIVSRNISEIPNNIQQGTFDFILLRPVPSQFGAAFRRVNIHQLGNLLAGIILLIYALARLSFTPSLLAILFFIIAAASGIIIFYSLLIMVVSLAFWLERFEGFWAFMYIFTEPLTVPFDIFPRYPRLALTYLLPLAFVVFVPAQALTGRLNAAYLPVGIALSFIFLVLANLAWRAGLRRYSSASS